MRYSFVAAALLAFAATPFSSTRGRAEGSIAYGNGRGGLSYDYRDHGAADDRALRECGYGCRIVSRFSNTCAAIAVGRSGGYGYARRDREGWAERAAIEECENQGNRGCSVAASGCDSR